MTCLWLLQYDERQKPLAGTPEPRFAHYLQRYADESCRSSASRHSY